MPKGYEAPVFLIRSLGHRTLTSSDYLAVDVTVHIYSSRTVRRANTIPTYGQALLHEGRRTKRQVLAKRTASAYGRITACRPILLASGRHVPRHRSTIPLFVSLGKVPNGI